MSTGQENFSHDSHDSIDCKTLSCAIQKAQRILQNRQREDGSWEDFCDMGPSRTAQVSIALHFMHQLNTKDAKDAARWLSSQQNSDGSFSLYPLSTEGDLGITACVWAALRIGGLSSEEEPVKKAWNFIEAEGGLKRVLNNLRTGDLSAIFVAMAGFLDPYQLPKPPVFFSLIKPAVRFLQKNFHDGVLLMTYQIGIIVRYLQKDWWPQKDQKSFLASLQGQKIFSFLEQYQNLNGSFNDAAMPTSLSVSTLYALGLSHNDSRILRGVQFLKGQKTYDQNGLYYRAFGSNVWSTAFDARALLYTGVPAESHMIKDALRWTIESQLTTPQPPANNTHKGAPKTGGWAFTRENETMADCDDAGAVLSFLGLALRKNTLEAPLATDVAQSIKKGQDWLFGMQNPDGGWSAFVYGLPGKSPGPFMTKDISFPFGDLWGMIRFLRNPPVALSDPSTEDITARVLHGLGETGYRVSHPEIKRAIEFLVIQQCTNGAWWGRWVNYLSSTAFVLMGLANVKQSMNAPWVQKGVQFLLQHQNPDGGWGEVEDSYKNPKLAGIGPSAPAITGLVISGLIEAGEGRTKQVSLGVEYLLREQRADGSWPDTGTLLSYIPPTTFYRYSETARCYPLEALGRYFALVENQTFEALNTTVKNDWNDRFLDEKRQAVDPLADKVVEDVFQQSNIDTVNELLKTILQSDDLLPKNLPENAKHFLEETNQLPDWADPIKIKAAQTLFSQTGWEVAAGLFCSSLPQAYAASNGTRVLIQTKGLTKHVRQRIFETAQFIFDVMDKDALSPEGRGIRAAQKVRLMHAAVRHLLLKKTQWNKDQWGMPLNQEDLAGTLMTFSAVTFDALKKLGNKVSKEDGENWLHAWKVIGHILGIQPELLPKNLIDAELLMEAIRRRQWAPSEWGREITQDLIELMEEYLPGRLFDGIPSSLIRFLAGDHCANLLGLPPTDWTRVIIRLKVNLETIFARKAKTSENVTRYKSVAALMMKAIVQTEREGKRAQFRIPKSLQNTVDPNF